MKSTNQEWVPVMLPRWVVEWFVSYADLTGPPPDTRRKGVVMSFARAALDRTTIYQPRPLDRLCARLARWWPV